MATEEGHQTRNVDYSFLAQSYDVSDEEEAEKKSEEKEKEEGLHLDNAGLKQLNPYILHFIRLRFF